MWLNLLLSILAWVLKWLVEGRPWKPKDEAKISKALGIIGHVRDWAHIRGLRPVTMSVDEAMRG